MSLCPRCEFDLGEPPASATCPRCGVRVNARRRSLSGFSLPVAATASSAPSSPPKSSSLPPRRDAEEDSWGVSDEVQRPPAPAPAAPVRNTTSVFRAPTHAAPHAREDAPQSDDAGPPTRVLGGSVVEEALARRAELDATPALPPVQPPGGAVAVGLPRRDSQGGGSTRATLVQSTVRADGGVGRSTLILAPDEALPQPEAPPATKGTGRATPLGFGAPATESVEPMRSTKSTLVMSAPLDLAPPAAPRGGSSERGTSTLIMTAAPSAPPESPRVATTLVMMAPPEVQPPPRGTKSTLVMTTSLEPSREPTAARPGPPPTPRLAMTRPRLDLRPPTRDDAPVEAVPDPSPVRDTVDPLAQTMPVEDLLADLALPDDPTPLLSAVAPVATVAPPRPPAIETARVDALVSTRAAGVRLPRAASRSSRRLRVLGGAAAATLLIAPWFAPMRPVERAVALLGGLFAAVVAASPRQSDAPGAVAVAAGTPLLGAWLLLTSDLSPMGLGLTLAVLLVLPGVLFHRGDRPESSRSATLVGVGLAVGVAWTLLPAAGALLGGSVPPVLPREYATVALLPWLLLGGMSLPRATAGASGAPFAAGVVLWSGALAMLRSAALAVHAPSQWRVVAVTGVVAAALAALLSAGVARALDTDEA
jgi:hypothetical protein